MEWTDQRIGRLVSRVSRKEAWRFKGDLDSEDLAQDLFVDFLELQRSQPQVPDKAFLWMFHRKVRWRILKSTRRYDYRTRGRLPYEVFLVSDEGTSRPGQPLHPAAPCELQAQVDALDVLNTAPDQVAKVLRAELDGSLRLRFANGKLELRKDAVERLTGLGKHAFWKLCRRWSDARLHPSVSEKK